MGARPHGPHLITFLNQVANQVVVPYSCIKVQEVQMQMRGAMHVHELDCWLHYLLKYNLKSIPSQPTLFMSEADDA